MLVGVAQVGTMHLDFAQHVMRRRQNFRNVQTHIKSVGLVEDVGETPCPRLHMHLMAALARLFGMDALEFIADVLHL